MAQRLYPKPAKLTPDQIYEDLELPGGRPGRPYVVINMVSTVDGKVTVGGRAGVLGSRLDRALMRRLRATVDAVMVGAGTLRAEAVDPGVPDDLADLRTSRGKPPQPLAVTITRTLDLNPDHRFFRLGRDRSVVFTGTSGPAERAAVVSQMAVLERVESDYVEVGEALGVLRERYGVERLVVEGGPTLNHTLVQAGLVDELFWTIAPKLVGGRGDGLLRGPELAGPTATRLELVSLFEHDGELFARYRFTSTGRP